MFNRKVTSSIYVVYQNKVLLHRHKVCKVIFPLGGRIENHEVPHEAAIREALEEAGLEVELYRKEKEMDLGKVVHLHNPVHTVLEAVGSQQENLSFVYYAKAFQSTIKPSLGESTDLFWLTEEEVINHQELQKDVKMMALEALYLLAEEIVEK